MINDGWLMMLRMMVDNGCFILVGDSSTIDRIVNGQV